MKKNKIFRKAAKIVLFFVAFFIYQYGLTLVTKNFQDDYLDVLLTYSIYYVTILAAFYWSLGGNKNDKITIANVLKSIILFILFNFVVYLYYYIYLPSTGRTYFKDAVGRIQFLWSFLELYITYFAYAFFYWLYKRSLRIERQLRLTEKARLEAEINHLRTQINPHFLFNTLNTFYSQSLGSLPDTARGIFLLSKIMRYSLAPLGTNGKVPLDHEIAHVNDYIELMKIRLPGKLMISHNLPGEAPKEWQILPHLLITLVENAFKHGDRDHPFIFDLQMDKEKKRVTFRVENHLGSKQAGTGVGLRNLKERLLYAYGTEGSFVETFSDNRYTAMLAIPDAYLPEKNGK